MDDMENSMDKNSNAIMDTLLISFFPSSQREKPNGSDSSRLFHKCSS